MSETKAKEQEMEESKSNWKIKEVTKSFLGKKKTTYKIITRCFEHENSRNPVEVTKVIASTGSKETAKLIASAPDMLEFLYRLDYEMYYNPDTKHWKTEIFELINKAEGK